MSEVSAIDGELGHWLEGHSPMSTDDRLVAEAELLTAGGVMPVPCWEVAGPDGRVFLRTWCAAIAQRAAKKLRVAEGGSSVVYVGPERRLVGREASASEMGVS